MVYFFLRVLSLLSHKSIFTLFVSWLNYVCHKVCFMFLCIRLSISVRMNILSIFRLHFVWIIFFGFCLGFFVLFCFCFFGVFLCLFFFLYFAGFLVFFGTCETALRNRKSHRYNGINMADNWTSIYTCTKNTSLNRLKALFVPYKTVFYVAIWHTCRSK